MTDYFKPQLVQYPLDICPCNVFEMRVSRIRMDDGVIESYSCEHADICRACMEKFVKERKDDGDSK